MRNRERETVPISEKYGLTIEEAAAYFGVGEKKLREISAGRDCPFVIWIGSKRIIKREACKNYLESQFSI